MIEVTQSDFARLEADTTAAEATAQKEGDTFMTDPKVDKESKSKDIEHKTAKKQDQSVAGPGSKEEGIGGDEVGGDAEGVDKHYGVANSHWIDYWKAPTFQDCAKGWTKVKWRGWAFAYRFYGVRPNGVFAVVEHWIRNKQEISSGSESSEVDDEAGDGVGVVLPALPGFG
jgi:hypothetical protein